MSKEKIEKLTQEIRQKLITARKGSTVRPNGISQKDVAFEKIVSQSELSKMESGKRGIDFLTILRLASFYQRDLIYFVPEEFKFLFSIEDINEDSKYY